MKHVCGTAYGPQLKHEFHLKYFSESLEYFYFPCRHTFLKLISDIKGKTNDNAN